MGGNSKIIVSMMAAVLVIAACIFVISGKFASKKNAPSATEISDAYSEVFSVTSCRRGAAGPIFINSPSRIGLRLVCDAKGSADDAAQLHLEEMRGAHYLFLDDSIGADGIRRVRGCKSGVIAIVNVGMVNGTVKLEQRVHWSIKEYESLPESCRRE